MKMEQTECSETSAYKLQTPEYYPKESIKQAIYNLRILKIMLEKSCRKHNCNIRMF